MSKDQDSGLSDTELAAQAKHLHLTTFKGCFSKDTLPRLGDNQCAIVNIEDSVDEKGEPLPGSHWVAAGRRQGQSWYYDSFGLGIPPDIKAALRAPIFHVSQEFQSPSSQACGLFALAACATSESSDPVTKSLGDLTKRLNRPNLNDNDQIIKNFLHYKEQHMSGSGIVYDYNHTHSAYLQ